MDHHEEPENVQTEPDLVQRDIYLGLHWDQVVFHLHNPCLLKIQTKIKKLKAAWWLYCKHYCKECY